MRVVRVHIVRRRSIADPFLLRRLHQQLILHLDLVLLQHHHRLLLPGPRSRLLQRHSFRLLPGYWLAGLVQWSRILWQLLLVVFVELVLTDVDEEAIKAAHGRVALLL